MEYELFDTHAHPQFPQYDGDREAVLARAHDARIGIVCIGTDIRTSKQAIDIARSCDGVYASIGLHPNGSIEEQFSVEAYAELVGSNAVVAIGEIGLDYYRTEAGQARSLQLERFERQLELATATNLPVILHCRDAYEEMYAVLQRHTVRGIIHSFTGSVAQASPFLDLGYGIGLNAITTFSSDYRELVRYVPDDRLLLETDAPFLAPDPHRGRRNEPFYIIETAKRIAEIRNTSYEKLAETTTNNALEMFSILN